MNDRFFSHGKKIYIDSEAKRRGLKNIQIMTREISLFESLALEFDSFDRVMSIEMFEHFKNYEILLSKISDVLTSGGKLFIHIFTHKDFSYPLEVEARITGWENTSSPVVKCRLIT